ncbi:Alpha/Beta hydrolase protein [Aspergillus ambiguus]|uniref:alpha/beta hydrolase n=1 Tax=Aspergillus ambiguus TaxID=176160 RepID=UPI003CCE0380
MLFRQLLWLWAAIPLSLCLSLSIPHHRSFFYIGGNYTVLDSGEHIRTNQVYVERLTPLDGPTQRYPLVFIHGTDQTGTNWINKPDGGNGWASYFLSEGFECYLLDQAARGRSPWDNSTNGPLNKLSAENLQRLFTAPERYALWPQAINHTQWPGTGLMGDPIFDAFYASTVPSVDSEIEVETIMRRVGVSLLLEINSPTILIGHSQGAALAWVAADERPDLVRAVVAIEPAGPPFREAKILGSQPARPYGVTNTMLTYDPPVTDPENDLVKRKIVSGSPEYDDCILQAEEPRPRRLVSLGYIPQLLVTTDASHHAGFDWCTARFLIQAGVNLHYMELKRNGIKGNAHMMMLEKNSDDVAGVIAEWIRNLDFVPM